MSNWLNLNESLSNLKGQISNFANNVLAESEEGVQSPNEEYESLKRICAEKDHQIENLKKINSELQKSSQVNGSHNDESNWEWVPPEETTPKETVSDLKRLIRDLENEKDDLSTQLEQLDAENQQNIAELVSIREKLQEENLSLKEKCDKLKHQLKTTITSEKKLQKQLQDLQSVSKDHTNQVPSLNDKKKSELLVELEEKTKELSVLKSTHDTLEKTLEEFKTNLKDYQSKLALSEAENKVIYAELQQAKEQVRLCELKSQEDTENCQKLAFILESYEKQVTALKEELDDVKNQSKNNVNREKDVTELENNLSKAIEELDQARKELELTKQEHQEARNQVDGLRERLQSVNEENKVLQCKNDELITSKNEKNSQVHEEDIKEFEINLKKALEDLSRTQNELELTKQEHQTARTQVDELLERLQALSEENKSLQWKQVELDAVTNQNKNNQELHENNTKELEGNLKKALEDLDRTQKELELTKREHQKARIQLNQSLQALSEENKTLHCKKDDMHRSYINIITDNVKRFMDSGVVSPDPSEDPQILEFSKQVESIFKILLEFKEKCQQLERQVLESSQEKSEILNEKNTEIEKLMQNSEVLSQEIIEKSNTIKELEIEITNLVVSDDELIQEFEAKNQSRMGLETIPESNEDNMVLLETALENANEKIKELEKKVEHETKSVEEQESFESDPEVNDYKALLNNFDSLKIDYDLISKELTNTKSRLDEVEDENENIKSQLDRNKSDFENVDYQLSEANFTIDNLREEIETIELKMNTLAKEYAQTKIQAMNSVDLKTELNEVREKYLSEENTRRNLENQVKNLTEKLQNSKMVETSFKLQCDTLSKENLALTEARNNLESSLANIKTTLADYEKSYTELLQKYDEILIKCEGLSTQLHEKDSEILKLNNALLEIKDQKENEAETGDLARKLEERLRNKEQEIIQLRDQFKEFISKQEEVDKQLKNDSDKNEGLVARYQEEIRNLREELRKLLESGDKNEVFNQQIVGLQAALDESKKTVQALQLQIQDLNNSRNELINMVTVKHQESLTYHNEIQRLSEVLKGETEKSLRMEAQLVQASSSSEAIAKKDEEIDKLNDEINFLKEKCDILTKNLLEEQSSKSGPSDKEVSLFKQLERLQSHLMEVEEHYTQELLQVEQKNSDLQAKLAEVLQKQLQMVTNQRDELRKKISDAEDANSKQAVALTNLQFVLEQFQKDREKDVIKETERIRRQINTEKQVQEELKKEIENLKRQLDESRQGLQAASRLSDQLEMVKKQNSGLKDEVSQLQQKLNKSQQEIQNLTSQTDGKVEKGLIKNLVVGFLSSGNTNWTKDQTQVLKIIATVLDFNQQDHDKVKLNKSQQQGSWLGSILSPHAQGQNMSQESLSQAFVKFLENESKPRIVPNLLDSSMVKPTASEEESSKKQTPIVLNEIVLPTFADFGQSRNSSSILKDVLKDNNNT